MRCAPGNARRVLTALSLAFALSFGPPSAAADLVGFEGSWVRTDREADDAARLREDAVEGGEAGRDERTGDDGFRRSLDLAGTGRSREPDVESVPQARGQHLTPP